MLDVNRVGYDDIVDYLNSNQESIKQPWVQVVTDQKIIKMMLNNGSYGKQRRAYGLFHRSTMIGYCVVNPRVQSLDLLHIAEGFRGKGLAERFLRQFDIDNVVVDPRNEAAIHLYSKLNYNLSFAEEAA